VNCNNRNMSSYYKYRYIVNGVKHHNHNPINTYVPLHITA